MLDKKRCSRCRQIKAIECFDRNKNNKDGRTFRCKKCKWKYNQKNKKEIAQYNKKYRQEHKKEITQYSKTYCQEHKKETAKCRAKHYQKNKKKLLEKATKYYQEHKDERKLYNQKNQKTINQTNKIRYKTNSSYNLSRRMSRAIQRVKNPLIKKGQSWKQLVPYTLIELKKHLKSTLPKGYSWKDFMQGRLHIDHILPKAIFQYEKAEDLGFQICWGLDNLRLLPAKKNSSKGAKLIKPFQKHFSIEIEIKNGN